MYRTQAITCFLMLPITFLLYYGGPILNLIYITSDNSHIIFEYGGLYSKLAIPSIFFNGLF